MALADYEPERVTIEYKGKALASVRGLNFEDVTALIKTHLPALQAVYVDARLRKLLPNDRNIQGLILDLIIKFPETAAKAIEIASDEPGTADKARRLPLPLQMKLFIEIVRLTFEDVGGPLVFVAYVKNLIDQHFPTLTDSVLTPSATSPTIQ